MKQLLSLKQRPDGVFCFNDPLAMGAINEAINRGLRIPEDVPFLAVAIFTTMIHCACPSRASTRIMAKLAQRPPTWF